MEPITDPAERTMWSVALSGRTFRQRHGYLVLTHDSLIFERGIWPPWQKATLDVVLGRSDIRAVRRKSRVLQAVSYYFWWPILCVSTVSGKTYRFQVQGPHAAEWLAALGEIAQRNS